MVAQSLHNLCNINQKWALHSQLNQRYTAGRKV